MNSENFTYHSIISNLISVMTAAVQFSDHEGAELDHLHGSLQYYSGCGYPLFNGIFHNYKQMPDASANLDTAIHYFSERAIPFIWWWLDQAAIPNDISHELGAKGFSHLGDFQLMAAPIEKTYSENISEKIQIKKIDNDQDYQIFLGIICEVFNLCDSIRQDFAAMYQSYGGHGKFIHYLGYIDGIPAATGTVFMEGNIAGLYNGATLPQARQNGLCSALIINAMREAKLAGCEYAVTQLMANAAAKSLCEKIGFKNYGCIKPYLNNC